MNPTLSLRQVVQLPWLTSALSAAQLRQVAHATGLASSGPKPVLLARLAAELQRFAGSNNNSSSSSSSRDARPTSILSIDMGVRNLAFAHLLVSPGSRPGSEPTLTLTAWRRLAVAELAADGNETGTVTPTSTPTSTSTSTPALTYTDDTFSLDVYAAHAYTLATTLTRKFRPTHVLIERQRFRSGGASAVQEWTLRVGLFEAMLYAALHALRVSGLVAPSLVVEPVDPRRVAMYYTSGTSSSSSSGSSSTSSTSSSRTSKRVKIDLVGNWLRTATLPQSQDSPCLGASTNTRTLAPACKLQIDQAAEVRDTVDAYLARWQRRRQPRHSDAAPPQTKLDDLADCLLQGVTWMEWQLARERIGRDGLQGFLD